MARTSGGLVVYRVVEGTVEVLLVHPGGPLWAKRDDGAWSIPKGEIEPGDDPLATALREFEEEVGSPVVGGTPRFVGEVTQRGGKRVLAWAVEAAPGFEPALDGCRSTFTMEWPPRSGVHRQFPEVDRASWFALPEARVKVVGGQVALFDFFGGAPTVGAPSL